MDRGAAPLLHGLRVGNLKRAFAVALYLFAAGHATAQPRGDAPVGKLWEYDFHRPAGCTEHPTWKGGRTFYACAGEIVLRLFVDGATGTVVESSPGRVVDWPAAKKAVLTVTELSRQWAFCGGDDDVLAANPTHFKRYPDPLLGVCYVYWPEAGPVAAFVAEKARLKGLLGLHPYVVEAGRELMRRAWAHGLPFEVISGYRPFPPKRLQAKRGKKGWAAWHQLGCAFDVILKPYRSLKSAKAAYDEEPAPWEALKEIAYDVGLRWAGTPPNGDIFHFEWHPGFSGRLTPAELKAFLKLAGPKAKNVKKGWARFEPDG